MAAFSVTIDGMSAVLENINLTNAVMQKKINFAIQGAGIECQKLAKIACPVDTGRLRNSILYHPGDMECTVDTNVSYSRFVEFGTRYMAAQPYLYPAYTTAKMHLMEKLQDSTFNITS